MVGMKRFLLIVLVLTLLPGEVLADHNYPDSDGYVPIKWICTYSPPAGRSAGYVRNGEVRRHIILNPCYISLKGGGFRDLLYIYRHERAHSRGFSHFEGTPRTNAAYHPGYTLTGN